MKNGSSHIYHWLSPRNNVEFRRRTEACEFERLRWTHNDENIALEEYFKSKREQGLAHKVVIESIGKAAPGKRMIGHLEGQINVKTKKGTKISKDAIPSVLTLTATRGTVPVGGYGI